jgi:uncharacterized protein (UPF0303 family)
MDKDLLLDALIAQEENLRFDHFDHDLAIEIGQALYAAAAERGVAVAIDVSAWGQTVFHLAMEGTGPDNDQWIARKRAVVHRFQKSSFRVGRELAADGATLEDRSFVSSFEFSAHGGSFPVRLKSGGGVIGTITVSGFASGRGPSPGSLGASGSPEGNGLRRHNP